MSDHTYSDVVPFVSSYFFESSKYPKENDSLSALCDASSENFEASGKFGWTYDGIKRVGKHKRISGALFTKDKFKVWVINESEYASVCDYQLSLVADDRESIEEFAKDWGLSLKLGIEEQDTVNQTN